MKVLTMGTFDLFHAGHVAFLRRCRDIAGAHGRVIVGLNTDRFAASYKRPPTIGYDGRETVLLACRYVDAVVPNDQPAGSAIGLVTSIRPDVIAATMDYHPSNGKDWFRQVGIAAEVLDVMSIRVEWVTYTQGVSTTAIAARM